MWGRHKDRLCAHLLGTLELVVGSDGHGQDVLVRVDERVHDRGQGWDTGGQGDGGNGLDTRHELGDEGRLLNVQDLGWEDGTVVVDLNDRHTVGERRDVEHVQEGGLGRSDLGTGRDDLDVIDDFDGTSGDLGWDTKGLEERGLSWLHTGVSGWDVDVVGGDGTGPSWGSDLVGEDDLSDVLQVARGEDETDVASDIWEELLELGELGEDASESSSDHSVLAHEHDTFSSEGLSDQVELLGRDVVNVDDEDGWVLLDQSLELDEVDLLLGSCSTHCCWFLVI